ncbi:MAG: hypothetical protein AB8G22_02885 [Saprospiraceae bacterium]
MSLHKTKNLSASSVAILEKRGLPPIRDGNNAPDIRLTGEKSDFTFNCEMTELPLLTVGKNCNDCAALTHHLTISHF